MTHDELLAMIKPMTNNDAIFMKDALRAVVELHKPITHRGYEDEGFFCNNCEFDYPCLTIQAIEKELE
jgi:hypothetical protein